MFLVACVPDLAVNMADDDNSTVVFKVGNKTIEVDTMPEIDEPTPLNVVPIISISANATQDEQTSINISATNIGDAAFNSDLSYEISVKNEEVLEKVKSNISLNLEPNETMLLENLNFEFEAQGIHKVIVIFSENQSNSDQLEFEVLPTKKVVRTINQEKLDRAISEGGCYDTDGGQDFDDAGTCYDNATFQYGRTDFCSGDEDVLGEVYCQQFKCSFIIEECENTCRNGECI